MKIWRWLAPKKARILTAAERALEQPDDVSGVGLLAEALWISDGEMHRQVERALIRLLPRLLPADAANLNEEQRHCLYRALQGKNLDLVLAILVVIEIVGDYLALPHVQRLAEMDAKTPGEARIRQAARECRSFLQTRIETEQVNRTLLRSSYAPSVPPDALRQALRQVTPGDWKQGQHHG